MRCLDNNLWPAAIRFFLAGAVVLGIGLHSGGASAQRAGASDAPLSDSERKELIRLRQEVRELKRSKSPSIKQASAGEKPASEAYAAIKSDYNDLAKDPRKLEGAKAFDQRFFLRKNPIDAAYYLYPVRAALDAKGAALTVTQDDLAAGTTLAVQAFSSYVVWRPELPGPHYSNGIGSSFTPVISGYAAAPFIYANGQLGEPRKASERSALQFGIDNQIETAAGLFPLETLRLTPYAQTDFRGLASIAGISGSYEPYLVSKKLGGNADGGPQVVGYYFRTIAEADVFRVDNQGLTDFLPRTTYAFVGGTAQINATLFQNMPEMKDLCGRIHLNAQYQYYRDVANNHDLRNFHSGISVDVGGKPSEFCVPEGTKYVESPGVMAVALTYDRGTDKTTMVDAKKYQLQLTLKY